MEKFRRLRRCFKCGRFDEFTSTVYEDGEASFICEPCFEAYQMSCWEDDFANKLIDERTYKQGLERQRKRSLAKSNLLSATDNLGKGFRVPVAAPFPSDKDAPKGKTRRHSRM